MAQSCSDNLELVGEQDPALERIAAILLSGPQAPQITTHHFSPGIYIRKIIMFAGTILIGQRHRFEHFNIVLTGKFRVLSEGKLAHFQAPCMFLSGAGAQKVLYIEHDTEFLTVHANPTEERDPEKLTNMVAFPSEAFEYFKSLTRGETKDLEAQTKEPQ